MMPVQEPHFENYSFKESIHRNLEYLVPLKKEEKLGFSYAMSLPVTLMFLLLALFFLLLIEYYPDMPILT